MNVATTKAGLAVAYMFLGLIAAAAVYAFVRIVSHPTRTVTRTAVAQTDVSTVAKTRAALGSPDGEGTCAQAGLTSLGSAHCAIYKRGDGYVVLITK